MKALETFIYIYNIPMLEPNVQKINGPFNVVRLEGNVNDINKVIYIFMDRHVNVGSQIECDNIYSKDIHLFFAQSFRDLAKSSKTYDFFLEIFPHELKYEHEYQMQKELYIRQVRKLFAKLFEFDPNSNKVSVSKYFENVRLHMADIRTFFSKEYFYEFNFAISEADHMNCYQSINTGNMHNILNFLNRLKTHVERINGVVLSYLSGNPEPVKKTYILIPIGEEYISKSAEEKLNIELEYFNYVINKIYNQYKHDDVKLIIRKKINKLSKALDNIVAQCNHLIKNFEDIYKYYENNSNKLVEYKSDYNYFVPLAKTNKMTAYIVESINKLEEFFLIEMASFMDCYFLRRFLDKDYITNVIAYTGALHSIIYIEFLVKEFGFKVTHASYSKISNINELNSEIKKSKNYINLKRLFYPPVFNQCSDLTHFPKHFL